MCGIAGFFTTGPSELPDTVITRMTDVIQHRGPDDCGYYRDAFVALGHRRLSIVDLSAGRQPMFNENRELCVIFNGEIFNHAEIRPTLERNGHRYVSRSDTETILHAYEEYGPHCVDHFRGMFAFAIWDRVKRVLFCARDRLGVKPFYYYSDGRVFAFASEIKSLLQHPAISGNFDESLLPEYLAFGYSSGEQTLFRGIRKLMPGHSVTVSAEGLSIRRYWDVPESPPADAYDGDDDAWIRECRGRLEETVRMRLMSDVPLGMFLSGGLDSSAIAALMSRMVEGRVKTFSVGYRETAFSELSYAREVAQSIGTDHHEVLVSKDEFFGALPKLTWHEDEPIAWPSSVPLHFVSKLAAERVKVVLSGEGADELFGGYARYRFYRDNEPWMTRYANIPASLRRRVRSMIEQTDLLPASMRRKIQHTLLGHEPIFEGFYIDNFYSAFPSEDQRQILSRGSGDAAFHAFLGYWQSRGNVSLLDRLLYADQKTYLVELLMRQDQMSMASSIESRVPFLDHPFVEFAARVPDRLKIRDATGKYILKRAVADLLPASIVYRKKMGFPTPLRDWFRGAAARPLLETLWDRKGFLAEYLDRPFVQALVERHLAGRIDATDRLWRLVTLDLWGQIFLSGARRSSAWRVDEIPVGE